MTSCTLQKQKTKCFTKNVSLIQQNRAPRSAARSGSARRIPVTRCRSCKRPAALGQGAMTHGRGPRRWALTPGLCRASGVGMPQPPPGPTLHGRRVLPLSALSDRPKSPQLSQLPIKTNCSRNLTVQTLLGQSLV